MDWLLRSFQENSILWIFISVGVGGIIGASIKFFFDQVLAHRLRQRREISRIVIQYSNPILRAANSLERRINVHILNIEQEGVDFDNNDYCRLSFLYLFSSFLGWSYILEREVQFLEFETSGKSRQFQSRFYMVFKAFSSFDYFQDIAADVRTLESSTIPRLVLTAIGELMIKNQDSHQTSSKEVIEFTTFTRLYEECRQFRRWLKYLEDFISGLKPSATCLRWDRLILIAASLQMLISFLDPKGTRTTPRHVSNLELIQNSSVRERLLQEIHQVNRSLIATFNEEN